MIFLQNPRLQLNGNKMKRIFLLIVCAFGFYSNGLSQQQPFSFYKNLFVNGQYQQLENELETYSPEKKNIINEFSILFIKTLNRQQKYHQVSGFSVSPLFSDPSFAVEYYYELGTAALQIKDFQLSFNRFIAGVKLTSVSDSTFYFALDYLISQKLPYNDVLTLLSKESVDQLLFVPDLLIKSISKPQQVKLLENWNLTNQSQKVKQKLDQLKQTEKFDGSRQFSVGLLLPIGKYKTSPGFREFIGRDILAGFLQGVEEINGDINSPFHIHIRDTESNPVLAKEQLIKLIVDDKVDVIIGPVFSEECHAILEISNSYQIPIITPTATDDNLFEKSPYFFGLNPSFKTRGIQTAKKSMELLDMKVKRDSILVMAPSNSGASKMADAFLDMYHSIGWGHLAKGNYPAGSMDIRGYIPIVSQDTMQYRDYIYTPIEDEKDIDIVVSQLSFKKVWGRYIFNTPWANTLKLRNYRHIINGAIIAKDSDIDTLNYSTKKIKRNYQIKYGKEPTAVSYRGYDAATVVSFLFSEYKNGQFYFDQLLRNMKKLSGVQNDIDFQGSQNNQSIRFYMFKDNELIRIE